MSATILDLTTRLAQRKRSNVIPLHRPLSEISLRIERRIAAMQRLLQDLNVGWTHACPALIRDGRPVVLGVMPGERCPLCNLIDPNEPTPPEAA